MVWGAGVRALFPGLCDLACAARDDERGDGARRPPTPRPAPPPGPPRRPSANVPLIAAGPPGARHRPPAPPMAGAESNSGAMRAAALAAAAAAAAAVVLVARRRRADPVVVTSEAELAALAVSRSALARALDPPPTVRLADAGLKRLPVDDLMSLRVTTLDVGGNPGLDWGGVERLTALTALAAPRCGLRTLPPALLSLTRLRALDVSHNELTGLDGVGALTRLQRLNAASNALASVPADIGALASLTLLGLRDNALTTLPDSVGGLTALRELYLTSNRLTALPQALGACAALQKLQCAFNPSLDTVPESLASLPKLEMLRLAACGVTRLPPAFARAPALAWVSLAGNPLAGDPAPPAAGIAAIHPKQLKGVGGRLGDGASGEVVRATLNGADVAVKVFRGGASPDGRAVDEVAVSLAVAHPALARTVGTLAARLDGGKGPKKGGDPAAAPPGIVLERVPGDPLASKPVGDPLLRCTWARGESLAPASALRAAARVAGGLAHLHATGAAHGDVYAHNVVCAADGEATLVDFGAAFWVPTRGNFTLGLAPPPLSFEAFDVRAFGLLLRELAAATTGRAAAELRGAAAAAADAAPADRPRFAVLEARLARAHKALANA